MPIRPLIALAGVLALCGALVAGLPAAPRAVAVDVEIAIDTTGSMGPSLRAAQRDAERLVAAVRAESPAVRFAVVQFKDAGDSPEYELVQPLTADASAVATALRGLVASGGGDNPEAYNLVFRNSVADERTGWRESSRKLVVVLGDAEPHGAAASGLTGCLDASPDPHALRTRRELLDMRAAGRTLIMLRQVSSATVALQCYESLARAAYRGGAARDRSFDLGGLIRTLVARAVAPSSVGGADRTPPRVEALPSRGERGERIRLLYRVKDDSGRSSERVAVYSGGRVLTRSGWAQFGPATGRTYYFDFPAPSSMSGRYRFCVESRDPSGNISQPSCDTVTVL